jgi:hypothetical protein
MPAWLFSPDSTAPCTGIQLGRCSRRVVAVLFQPTSTPLERQAAVSAVVGQVVGGAPELGYYYVSVGGDGTLAALQAALATLRALPQVKRVSAFDVTPPELDGRAPNEVASGCDTATRSAAMLGSIVSSTIFVLRHGGVVSYGADEESVEKEG